MKNRSASARWIGTLAIGSFLAIEPAVAAQDGSTAPGPSRRAAAPQEAPRTAAFLFAYTPEKGREDLFEEGYRRHLEWHRQKADSLVWYGWSVLAGDRVGTFVDGTFGNAPAAIDRRVDPAGDAADFAQTTAPFADPLYRRAYRLRRDLSTATPLEDRAPSPLVHVYHYTIEPGAEARFERWVRESREAEGRRSGEPARTWYELVLGGDHPGYMLMVAATGLADLEPVAGAGLEGIVSRARSETWRYRVDLSYVPEP